MARPLMFITNAGMPRLSRFMVNLCVSLIAGIRLARELLVNEHP
jgi:hypothetical protein